MPPFEAGDQAAFANQRYPLSIAYQTYSKHKEQFLRAVDCDYLWMMFAVEAGRFSFTIDNVTGEASSGDIVLCPPNCEFQRHVIEPLSFYYVKFRFEEGSMTPAIELLRDVFGYKFTTSEQDRLYNNYRHLIRLNKYEDAESNRWKLHFVSDIWLMFYLNAHMYARREKTAADPLMKEAKDRIERHALRDIQMQDIAELLHIHPVQFTRRFQQVFGVSPSRYLSAIRMEKAKSMLLETEDTIEHIARRCGYENGFYFSRVFTKYAKMNPSHFRRIHRAHSP